MKKDPDMHVCGNYRTSEPYMGCHGFSFHSPEGEHGIAPIPDKINHPAHYTSSPAKCKSCGEQIECIDVTRHFGFSIGNVIKYLWRESFKGAALEDLKKARWYLDDEIKQREKK